MIGNKDITGMMQACGVVPVFYHEDAQVACDVVHACYAGGLRIFEFTNRGKHASAVFKTLQSYCRKNLPEMMLGAGSIVNGNSADDFIGMGADFIVSPLISESVIDVCRSKDILHIPGCGTVTEVGRAQKAGAAVVKLFPAEVLGPSFIRAIRGPMPWSNIMPTGGVTMEKENIKAWFDAGAFCIGMGSALFSRELIEQGDMNSLTQRVTLLLSTIQEVRDA